MRLFVLFIVFCSTATFAQMFTVVNPKNIKFDENRAEILYRQAVDAVRMEYHVTDAIMPTFILVLGASNAEQGIVWPNVKTWSGASIRLMDWNEALFRYAVIALTINELLRPENIKRLNNHIGSIESATVPVGELGKKQ